MRRAAKVDANQSSIITALKQIFGDECVLDLSAVGRGCPDLLVGVRGKNLLMEVKTDTGKLTTDQQIFHHSWPGQIHIIRCLNDALRIIEQETT